MVSVSLTDLMSLGVPEEMALDALDPLYFAVNAYAQGGSIEPYVKKLMALGMSEGTINDVLLLYKKKENTHASS